MQRDILDTERRNSLTSNKELNMAWVQNKKEYVNIPDKYPPFPWGYNKSHSDEQDSVIIVHFKKNSFRLSYFLFWSYSMELVDTNANSITL